MNLSLRRFSFCFICFLFFCSNHAIGAMIKLEELEDTTLRDNLKSYHGITSVLQTDEDADGYGGIGYNGFANFCMVADQRDTTRVLWYAVIRFMPSAEPWLTTRHTNIFWSKVKINVKINPETYYRVYGKYGEGMDRSIIVRRRNIFRIDNSLGDLAMRISQQRRLFMWAIEGRSPADLPIGVNTLQENRVFNHTTLQDFIGHMVALRTNKIGTDDFFPHYSLSGVAWKCDALNCVSFSFRVLNRLGVSMEGSPDLKRYLHYDYDNIKRIWKWTGLSYVRYLTWDGPPRAYPDRVIKHMFSHFLQRTPKDILDTIPRPALIPFVGDFDQMRINFPNAFH